MPWLLLLLLLFPAAGLPQKKPARKTATPARKSAPAQRSEWPIASITIEGNRNYPAEVIVAAAGLKVGQLAGKKEFDEAYARLVATGVFETIDYRFTPSADGKAYAAVFRVVEVEPVYAVRFEGLNAPPEELKAFLKKKDPFFGERIPATAAILERHAKAIEEYLAGKNRGEKVAGRVVSDKPNEFAIVFQPAAQPPAVAQVKFEGNQVVPTHVLLNTFAGVAYGLPYTEPGFRLLLNTSIRPIYESRGRLQVSFPKVAAEPAREVKGVVVTVAIQEGPTFDLGEVRVAGSPAIPAGELLSTGKFKTGELANFDEVNAGLERIRKRYRREGYMRVDTRVERQLNEKRKTVDLTVHLEEGPQFHFGKLIIEGLDIHGEAAIRKLWAMKAGKPFDADYPDYFLKRVAEDNIFDNLTRTRAALKVDEENRLVDVTLSFR